MGATPPTGNIYESADGDPQRQYGPGNRLLQKGNTKYEWDADGRLAEKREVTDDGERVWSYAWNGAGLLQSVDPPDGKRVEFAYDPFARRMEKRVARVVDGDVQPDYATRFVWDGDVLAHEVRTRAAASGDEIVEERAYVFEDGEFDPAAQRDGQKWLHYSNEINGAPNRLVDSRGESECEIERDAWGATHLDGKASTPFGFAGQYRDEETGLSYNRWRYYDGRRAGFVSADPLGLSGAPNTYLYVPNPFEWVDPLGLALNKKLKGKLRKIVQQLKRGGNRTCPGKVDRREARKLGEEFVGPGYSIDRTDRGQLVLISQDGLRRYREPSEKPGSPYTQTGVQANFESRRNGRAPFPRTAESNVHLDIKT